MLGGVIGLERELNDHPAGMRTHLLVSVGSAVFTVLSIGGFEAPPGPNGVSPSDPGRVAAQIVSGIGFLGAGAILKYGTTIKGLTTAASLWATAAVGMAAGAGEWVVGIVGTAIIVVALGPLHVLVTRLRLQGARLVRIRVAMDNLDPLGDVTGELANRRIDIADLRVVSSEGRLTVELDLRIPAGAVPAEVMQALGAIKGVDLIDASRGDE